MTDNGLSLEERKAITDKEYANYKNSFPEVKARIHLPLNFVVFLVMRNIMTHARIVGPSQRSKPCYVKILQHKTCCA